jgi:hypothetical protein
MQLLLFARRFGKKTAAEEQIKLLEKKKSKLLSVRKLHDDLDYWRYIGTADDIFRATEQRREYKHLISKWDKLLEKEIKTKSKEADFFDWYSQVILFDLKNQLAKPLLLRESFYHLCKHNLKMLLRGWFG